jgi:putative methionine-R-sulfoxide reductase with GAF domain
MDHYSILDQSSSQAAPETAGPNRAPAESSSLLPATSREPLGFPGDDGGKSLTEMAERDLNATLQLLAERAQYITGASGAAIALREGGEMICRASAGPSAPELGAHLQVNSGLSGESVRTRQTLRCDDAETDPRVNRESCRVLGIASVVVMPLVRAQEANGVFELLSGRAYAFEERDITALERLGEMIQTAVEHAEAAKRAQKEIDGKEMAPPDEVKAEAEPDAKPAVQPPAEREGSANSAAEAAAKPESTALEEGPEDSDQPQAPPNERGNIGKCEKCGFPVSEGRTLCLDCETAQVSEENSVSDPASSQAPGFLAQYAVAKKNGWLRSHPYLIGTALLLVLTAAVLLWLR